MVSTTERKRRHQLTGLQMNDISEEDFTRDALGRELMHLGASRNHSHGLIIHDEDAPFQLSRLLVMRFHRRTNHIVHDF